MQEVMTMMNDWKREKREFREQNMWQIQFIQKDWFLSKELLLVEEELGEPWLNLGRFDISLPFQPLKLKSEVLLKSVKKEL